jgi:CHAD domain-containing protein
MGSVTPAALIQRHLENALAQLPAVFDGDEESIHKARIATRRLREVLPLGGNHSSRAVDLVRDAGRHLGRVRELDAMQTLLASMSRRVVGSALLVATLARVLNTRQQRERRQLVKALERLDLTTLPDIVAADRQGALTWRAIHDRLRRPSWAAPLWARISRRSAEASDAIRCAPGIYLPKRAHRARIAVKKLRYAVEVAVDTHLWRPADALLKELRRIQSALGATHDAQVLLDQLPELAPELANSAEVPPLRQALEAEIQLQYGKYVRRRQRVFHIADACARAVVNATRPHRLVGPVATVSAVAVPLFLLSRRDAS